MVTSDSKTTNPNPSSSPSKPASSPATAASASTAAAATVDGADLREQVRVLGDEFKELASLTKTALGQKVDATKSAASETYERGCEKATEYRDRLSHVVREQPIKAMLITVGVGAVIGLISGRR